MNPEQNADQPQIIGGPEPHVIQPNDPSTYSVSPSTPDAAPQPIINAPTSYNSTPLSTAPKPAPWQKQARSPKYMGFISLGLGLLAMLVFMLFTTSIFSFAFGKSLTASIIKSFFILAVAVGGVAVGLMTQKSKDKINLPGLMGLIVSTVMVILSFFVAVYLIKAQIELSKVQQGFETTPESSLED